ncbi:unnamed protein product [Paramecium primaurelia]|uniref:Cyclic nucleotide-binding domain-containing protein n=1 Tax=Paramecium primaurelia TaxID=5886 RepID=A0A8S1K647_PARPR|nr:unnamed protein product [Paramecium primaurelia]
MIPASLFQRNKKDIKKQVSESDEDETPMRRKNKLNFQNLQLVDFNDIADQEELDAVKEDALSNQFKNNSIREEEESDQSESTSRKKNIKQLRLPRLSEKRQLNTSEQMDQVQENQQSQEEPMAEPMAEFAKTPSPNRVSNRSPNQQSQKQPTLQNQDDSSSEFDIFSPDKSMDKEQPPRNIELDEKLSKLTQEANAIERILPNCIINPYGKFKSTWSGIMILLLIYVVLILPVRLAFETNTQELLGLDLSVDCIFFFDMVFTFFTAYEDERGIVIVEFKKIAINYMKGWFWIDLISTFPLYLILDPSVLPGASSVNGLLRLARLPRIYKLVGVLRVGNLIKHQTIQKLFFFLKLNKEYSLILKFIILTFVVIHLAGCFWYFIGTISPDPNNNWIVVYIPDGTSAVEQYIASVYFVLTILVTVGYGNILPVNNMEYVVGIIFQFLGVAFFAYVMGTLTFTFAKLSQKLTMIKEREIFFNELAHTYQLPKETHERLLMSIQNSIFSHSNQILEFYNEEDIIQELPPLVQGLVCEFIFKDIIEKIRFLQNKPRGFLRRLFRSIIPVFLNKGDAIFFRGEPADFVYFVIEGRLATKCEDQNGKIRTLIHVEGSYFGEVDILVSRARGESAIAESQAEVWKISKEAFLRILNDYEDVKMEILDYAVKKEKNRKSTVKIIKNAQFFELIAKSKKDQICLNKSQFILKIKEKMINSLNEIVKNKTENGKELFPNLSDLDLFLDKVSEYNKIKKKLQISDQDLTSLKHLRSTNYTDPEIEDSLLKGMRVQSHLQSIQEYL